MIRAAAVTTLSVIAAAGLVLCWLAIVAGIAVVMLAGYGLQRLDR